MDTEPYPVIAGLLIRKGVTWQGPTNCMSRYPGDTKKCRRATRYFAWVFRRDTRPGIGC